MSLLEGRGGLSVGVLVTNKETIKSVLATKGSNATLKVLCTPVDQHNSTGSMFFHAVTRKNTIKLLKIRVLLTITSIIKM